jgi:hypothetical protein
MVKLELEELTLSAKARMFGEFNSIGETLLTKNAFLYP